MNAPANAPARILAERQVGESARAQKLADITKEELVERIAAVAGRQLPLALPARNVDDVLRERLADRAAQLRVSAHAGERLELEHEVADLRRLIAKGRSS